MRLQLGCVGPFLVLLFAGLVGSATTVEAAQVAASIEFDAAARPAGLPEDMQPLPGASLKFLAIKAIDGFKVDAALWQPDGVPPGRSTILVQVHGSGANLAELPLRAVARALSVKGYAALSISTRQHDTNINTDNFFDVRKGHRGGRRDRQGARLHLDRARRAQSRHHPGRILRGHQLGPRNQGRGADRSVRQAAMEVAQHHHPGR